MRERTDHSREIPVTTAVALGRSIMAEYYRDTSEVFSISTPDGTIPIDEYNAALAQQESREEH